MLTHLQTTHPKLHTPRLYLREWRSGDLPAFAALNADPEVMKYFPKALTRHESDALVARIEQHFGEHGFGLWAVTLASDATFIGCVGLMKPSFDAHFTPCVEVGWRIAHAHWNEGYATEAASAAIKFAFTDFKLDSLVSFTVEANLASRRVMQKLGMHHSPADDFNHPRISQGDPLERHVLCRLSLEDWRAQHAR